MINLHDCFLLAFSAAPFVVGVCDLVIRNSVSFEAATGHEAILADAMRELGYNVQQTGNTLQFSGKGLGGTYANGKFTTTSRGESLNVDEVKRSFAGQAVRAAAKKFGWTVKQVGSKLTVTRRV